jgi:hypothetical protein
LHVVRKRLAGFQTPPRDRLLADENADFRPQSQQTEGACQPAQPIFRTRSVVGAAAAGLGVVLVVALIYLYGPMTSAKFGVIDDHQILSYFGTNKSVSIFDLPRILVTQTEVGSWGHTKRFRPVYFIFRILETAWHGLSPAAWYLTRIVILGAVAAGLGFAAFRAANAGSESRARQLCSLGVAALTGILVITLPASSDIVMRLGPSEIYVALGLMMLCVGIGQAWLVRSRSWAWVLTAIGAIIAIGSKEDGLIILPVIAAIYILRFPGGRARITAIGAGVIVLLFSAYVALGFLPAVAESGRDVYENSRSVGMFVHELQGNEFVAIAAIALLVTFVSDTVLQRPAIGTARSGRNGFLAFLDRRPHAIVAAVCMYVVLAELYFYQSYFIDNSFTVARYGLLTELATTVAIAAAVAALVELILRGRLRIAAIAALIVVLALPPTVEQSVAAVQNYRAESTGISAQLDLQYAQIQRGVADVKRYPDSQVVIFVQSPWEGEPAVGLTSFLRLDDHITSIFLRTTLPNNPAANNLEIVIVNELKRVAADGGWEQNGWRVRPYVEYDPSHRTACFYFDTRPAKTEMCSVTYGIDIPKWRW